MSSAACWAGRVACLLLRCVQEQQSNRYCRCNVRCTTGRFSSLLHSSSKRPLFVRCSLPAAQQRNHADDEVVVAQMREQLLARMRSLGSLQPPAEATACLEVSPCRAHRRHASWVLEAAWLH